MKYKVGLIQMAMTDRPAENLRKALAMVQAAAKRGAQVICLPELFASTYFCQREDAALFDLAEPIPGPTTQAVAKVARRRRVAVVAPVFERRSEGLYHNSLAVIDVDGSIAGVYRKMHIPDDPCYYEKFYFTPGDLGFRAFDTRFARIGTLICWDQWYPEAARLTALQGATILFYPTAIGWHPHEKETHGPAQREAWRTIQRAHAIANGVYVAAVNRVGHEANKGVRSLFPENKSSYTPNGGKIKAPDPFISGIVFWGTSFLCDPFGAILAEASTDEEETLIGEVDLARIEETRRAWPFLRDRRIDAYADITRRFLDAPRKASKKRKA
jgi:N-carbamoylputrescine amidase